MTKFECSSVNMVICGKLHEIEEVECFACLRNHFFISGCDHRGEIQEGYRWRFQSDLSHSKRIQEVILYRFDIAHWNLLIVIFLSRIWQKSSFFLEWNLLEKWNQARCEVLLGNLNVDGHGEAGPWLADNSEFFDDCDSFTYLCLKILTYDIVYIYVLFTFICTIFMNICWCHIYMQTVLKSLSKAKNARWWEIAKICLSVLLWCDVRNDIFMRKCVCLLVFCDRCNICWKIFASLSSIPPISEFCS